jgi:hypothetical protein
MVTAKRSQMGSSEFRRWPGKTPIVILRDQISRPPVCQRTTPWAARQAESSNPFGVAMRRALKHSIALSTTRPNRERVTSILTWQSLLC